MARPSEIPSIVIDTREQLPYEFKGFATERKKLGAGDYSLAGCEERFAVERKSKEDAYGCVGASRDRFVRCLDRLASLERACIVIEASLSAFAIPPARTLIGREQAVGSFIAWSVKYAIPVYWCDSRPYAERFVVKWLAACIKYRYAGAAVSAPRGVSPQVVLGPLTT